MKAPLRTSLRPRWRAIIAAFAVLIVGGVATAALTHGPSAGADRAAPEVAGGPADRDDFPPGSGKAFEHLSQQRSNRCNLQAAEIMSYPPSHRFQGSCCSRMDRSTYRHQVEHVRRYSHLSEVPRDPYDVSARLAQRLLRHDADLRLNADQGRTYGRAMKMTREKGPCCCACWRYNAFRGLSKHLIATRDWSASRLAELIEAIDGCGGAAGEHKHA